VARRSPFVAEQMRRRSSSGELESVHDEHGKIRGAVTVERDVTVRRNSRKHSRRKLARTAALYERVSTEAERLERMVEERTSELLALQRGARPSAALPWDNLRRVSCTTSTTRWSDHGGGVFLDANAENPAAVRDYAIRIAKAAETGARPRRGLSLHSTGAAPGRA
jgi:hypothetical protein